MMTTNRLVAQLVGTFLGLRHTPDKPTKIGRGVLQILFPEEFRRRDHPFQGHIPIGTLYNDISSYINVLRKLFESITHLNDKGLFEMIIGIENNIL